MEVINFAENTNGKLFCQQFNDVRLENFDKKYVVGNELIVNVRGLEWGVVKVEALYQLEFKNIRPVLSQLCYGKPPHYMATKLRMYYDTFLTKGVTADTIFLNIVFSWVKRNMEVQSNYLHNYWKEEAAVHQPVTIQGSLFD